jgi:hypothetical protein
MPPITSPDFNLACGFFHRNASSWATLSANFTPEDIPHARQTFFVQTYAVLQNLRPPARWCRNGAHFSSVLLKQQRKSETLTRGNAPDTTCIVEVAQVSLSATIPKALRRGTKSAPHVWSALRPCRIPQRLPVITGWIVSKHVLLLNGDISRSSW